MTSLDIFLYISAYRSRFVPCQRHTNSADCQSADTQEAGRATGAMSYAFITAFRQYPRQSYQELLQNTRAELKGKYSQKPQMSACHRECRVFSRMAPEIAKW